MILRCLFVSVFGSHFWDRLCVAIFAPRLLWAGYVDAWNASPPLKEQLRFWGQLAFCATIGGIYFFSDSNLFVLLAGWWAWRKLYSVDPAAAEAAAIAAAAGGAGAGAGGGGGAAAAAAVGAATAAKNDAAKKKK